MRMISRMIVVRVFTHGMLQIKLKGMANVCAYCSKFSSLGLKHLFLGDFPSDFYSAAL